MFLSRLLRAADHPYLHGRGGRLENNAMEGMQGMTLKSLNHHSALKPLFIILGGGVIFVGAYIIRLATKTTDINWVKSKDPSYPMEYYKDKQFKFLNPGNVDHSKYTKERPKYE